MPKSCIFITVCLLFLLILDGCSPIKTNATKSGKNYFETFYVGTDGTQYFIKPLLFEDDHKGKLLVDIAFRYKDEIKDSATINFSIKSPEMYKTIGSLVISNNTKRIKSDDVELLFNEKSKKNFVSRFTTKIPLSELDQLFENNEWSLELGYQDQNIEYKPRKKTKKVIETLKSKLFVVMQ